MLSPCDLPAKFPLNARGARGPPSGQILFHRRRDHPIGPDCGNSPSCFYTRGRQWVPDHGALTCSDPDLKYISGKLASMAHLLPPPEHDYWNPPPLPEIEPSLLADKYGMGDAVDEATVPFAITDRPLSSSTLPPISPGRGTVLSDGGPEAPPALLVDVPSGNVITIPSAPTDIDASTVLSVVASSEGFPVHTLRLFYRRVAITHLNAPLSDFDVPIGGRLLVTLQPAPVAHVLPRAPQFSVPPPVPDVERTPPSGRPFDKPRTIGKRCKTVVVRRQARALGDTGRSISTDDSSGTDFQRVYEVQDGSGVGYSVITAEAYARLQLQSQQSSAARSSSLRGSRNSSPSRRSPSRGVPRILASR